ncbi:MAG: type IV toxin-antitoxin system AbiEi family antitoxin domain-containing protein, partial [Pseudonocardiaceae bacterium]
MCCVSALVVHDLTDEIPTAVQVAVPRSHRPPRISYPSIEVFRFANATFALGLSMVEAALRPSDPPRRARLLPRRSACRCRRGGPDHQLS